MMLRRTALKLLPAAAWSLRADAPDPIESAIANKQIPGVVVSVRQHGKTIFELAAGFADIEAGRKMSVDDICMIASSSKPWAASTAMTAVDSGKLSLDDRVSKYFPEFGGSSTVRQCLCHTSGIFGNDGPREATQWIRNFDLPLKDAVAQIVQQPLLYNPGDKFDYGGASFCVAGRIVEMVTGQDFEAYMKKVLWRPLALHDTMYRTTRDIVSRVPRIYQKTEGGFQALPAVMETPGHRGPRPDGFVLVPGGIYSTVHDSLRFLEMHLAGGILDGKRILSTSSAMEMPQEADGEASESVRGSDGLSSRMAPFSHGAGAYGTELWVDPARSLVGAIFTQMLSAQARPFINELRKAFRLSSALIFFVAVGNLPIPACRTSSASVR